MISLYLRPDRTQVVAAKRRKDGVLEVETVLEIEPFLDAVTAPAREAESAQARLQAMFQHLKGKVDILGDDVYFVLPDYLFSFVEAVDDVSQEGVISTLSNALPAGENLEDFIYRMPILTVPPAAQKQTVYLLKKAYIYRLVEAAKEERVALISVEPASLSFFRAFGKWDQDYAIVEMFQFHASIVTYNPAGGVFRTDAPMLTEDSLRNAGTGANRQVTSAFAANDYACSKTYAEMRTDMEYIVLDENPDILQIPAVTQRAAAEMPVFPESVDALLLEPQDQVLWMSAIGTLLQDARLLGGNEGDEDDSSDGSDFLYASLPSFIHIRSGNLLPKDAQDAAKRRQWKRVLLRSCKALSTVFVTLTACEVAGILYFSSASIPSALQADYEAAQKDLEAMDNEISLIQKAASEHNDPVRGFAETVDSRPDGVGFTDITIGNAMNIGQKDANKNYVQVTAISGNEMLLQDFRSRLDGRTFIVYPTITDIQSDNKGFKTAKISVSKAENGSAAKGDDK